MGMFSASVLILTYNRPGELRRNVSELTSELSPDIEIIVIDNNSEFWSEDIVSEFSNRVRFIFMDENIGVAARNFGVKSCSSEFIITLDDDVFGLTQKSIDLTMDLFRGNKDLAAINFKVIDDATEEQVNWIHHREKHKWGNREFASYEISEGAVAVRRSMFLAAGGYPEHFFISHEGPYLALGLMNLGWVISYCPSVIVRHSHAEMGRVSWRRYYYDTRNVIWLAYRHLPLYLMLKKCFIEIGALLIYSLRDGYFKYWFYGLKDGVVGLVKRPEIKRSPICNQALARYKKIEIENAKFWYMLKVRLFNNKNKIQI
tara:strand:+ start:10587 stop:11534 length:948 start_codon:yes stop_codon:yes gene_type:complete